MSVARPRPRCRRDSAAPARRTVESSSRRAQAGAFDLEVADVVAEGGDEEDAGVAGGPDLAIVVGSEHGDFRSSASDRLFRLRRTKLDDSPSRNGAVARTPSPPSGFSTFTTSAPRSASCRVQKGAAMKLPTSTTWMPASADSGMTPL